MPKVGMGPLRRRQLVDATIASIHEYGLADTTVTRIAKKAGVSAGIVHHYFADKTALLFETMRFMLANLRKNCVALLNNAKTPQQRLSAVVEASFAPEQFSDAVTTAWLALYASARTTPRLAKILRLYHQRLESNLLFDLKKIDPAADHKIQAETIAALIDGLYLRAALNPALFQNSEPRRIIHQCIDQIALPDQPTLSTNPSWQ